MAETVPNAIIEVQRCFDMSDALALEYLNKADRYICANLPLRWTTEEVVLTAGTAEYNLSSETILRAWQGRYRRTSTSSYVLRQTDITKLDLTEGDWRANPNNEPSEFCIKANSSGGAAVLFSDTPPTTSSPASTSGFPRVTLYVTTAAALTTADSLPAMLGSSDVYAFRAAYRYACDYVKDKKEEYYNLYRLALKEETELLQSRTAYQPQEFVFDFGSGGPV